MLHEYDKLNYILLHRCLLRRVWGYQRICQSKKNREHNGQKKKDKRTNNDLQNIHITGIPLKTGGEFRCWDF